MDVRAVGGPLAPAADPVMGGVWRGDGSDAADRSFEIFSPRPARLYYRRITKTAGIFERGDEIHRRASDSVHADRTVTPTAAP
jgi:hypothetical protein